jgi:hypothetical protein
LSAVHSDPTEKSRTVLLQAGIPRNMQLASHRPQATIAHSLDLLSCAVAALRGETCGIDLQVLIEFVNLLFILRSSHNVNEMNAYWADRVCLIQLGNRWTYLDDIWYRRHDIGVCPKIVTFAFLKLKLSHYTPRRRLEGGEEI